jgi:hypothetical protein
LTASGAQSLYCKRLSKKDKKTPENLSIRMLNDWDPQEFQNEALCCYLKFVVVAAFLGKCRDLRLVFFRLKGGKTGMIVLALGMASVRLQIFQVQLSINSTFYAFENFRCSLDDRLRVTSIPRVVLPTVHSTGSMHNPEEIDSAEQVKAEKFCY